MNMFWRKAGRRLGKLIHPLRECRMWRARREGAKLGEALEVVHAAGIPVGEDVPIEFALRAVAQFLSHSHEDDLASMELLFNTMTLACCYVRNGVDLAEVMEKAEQQVDDKSAIIQDLFAKQEVRTQQLIASEALMKNVTELLRAGHVKDAMELLKNRKRFAEDAAP